MYFLKAKAVFDSAHFLSGYDGKCANIHGHRWEVEAVFYGATLQSSGVERGMLRDFKDIKGELKSIADSLDHAFMYEAGSLKESTVRALEGEGFRLIALGFRPTAENLARYFFERLKEKGLPVKGTTVYETPDNCAGYEEDI